MNLSYRVITLLIFNQHDRATIIRLYCSTSYVIEDDIVLALAKLNEFASIIRRELSSVHWRIQRLCRAYP